MLFMSGYALRRVYGLWVRNESRIGRFGCLLLSLRLGLVRTMPSLALEREASSMPEPRPALVSLRSAILVQRSSKELTDDDGSRANESTRKPASHEVGLKDRHEGTVHATTEAVAWRLRQDPERTIVCVLSLVLMCAMAVISLKWLERRRQTTSQWVILMETSGFVDWPRFEDASLLPMIYTATLNVIAMVSVIVVPWSLLTRHEDGIRQFACVMALTMFVSYAGYLITLGDTSIDNSAVDSLSLQTRAVESFNREVCYAWCRHNEGNLPPMVTSASCRLKDEKSVFDEVFVHFMVKDWCSEAIAQQKFYNAAQHKGESPFLGLKGRAGLTLTTTRPDTLVNINGVLGSLVLACFTRVIA